MTDRTEAMLALLAPEVRPADARFVTRVERAMRERRLYRAARARIVRQLAGQASIVAACGGSIATLAQAPGVRDLLVMAPWSAWGAVAALAMLALASRPGRSALG